MNISLKNLSRPSNKNFKAVADYLLYTLPLVSTAIMTVPLAEPIKLWVMFGLNIIVIGFKGLSKFSAEDKPEEQTYQYPTYPK
jgi:hypothetical protein